MNATDWWNDLYNETDTPDSETRNTNQDASVPQPVFAGSAPTEPTWWSATPAHHWGSANRPVDPFLSDNPGPADIPTTENDTDNTPEEIAELARHAKDESAPSEEKTVEFPPMPSTPPVVHEDKEEEKEEEKATGVKALLKTFRKQKEEAATKKKEAISRAAQKRQEAIDAARARYENAKSRLESARTKAASLKGYDDDTGHMAYRQAVQDKKDARQELRTAAKEMRETERYAKQNEKEEVENAKQDEKETVKEAAAEAKATVGEKAAPIRAAHQKASTAVAASFGSGWSFLWPMAAAQAIPVTFPLALLDRLAMIFGSPRPLSGTERMDWNLLHGPGAWFGEQLAAYDSVGEMGRLITLCAVGAVPVMFAQLGERIVRDRLRKAVGWFAYGAPTFFICMPSYIPSFGFHQVSDLYLTALSALSWWGLSFSRTIKPGFLQAVLRIPVAALIVGFGHYAPGAAF